MQFTQRPDIVFASRIIWIQPKRLRVADQADIAPAELAVRSRQMKVPVELLADSMHDNWVLRGRKFIHPPGPKRDGKPNEQYGLDQYDAKVEVGRNSTT